MLPTLKSVIRNLLVFNTRMRLRGHSLVMTWCYCLPLAVITRAYAKLARKINADVLVHFNNKRFAEFLHQSPTRAGPRFYVIAMPRMLHFLLPCLRLIPPSVDAILIDNGLRTWENKHLRKLHPDLPLFKLTTLPFSSLEHGATISLFLRHDAQPFGILDHDTYIFNEAIYKQLEFAPMQCILGLFRGESVGTGWSYPLTHFLFFNTPVLRDLMSRHQVDARLYRTLPPDIQEVLRGIGLTASAFIKDYHQFFDTLHLLLALAYAEGYSVGYIKSVADEEDVFHVGGTSVGSFRTKDLLDLSIQWRFLEFVDDPLLNRRYRPLLTPFTSYAEIRARLPARPEIAQIISALDRLLDRLQASRGEHR